MSRKYSVNMWAQASRRRSAVGVVTPSRSKRIAPYCHRSGRHRSGRSAPAEPLPCPLVDVSGCRLFTFPWFLLPLLRPPPPFVGRQTFPLRSLLHTPLPPHRRHHPEEKTGRAHRCGVSAPLFYSPAPFTDAGESRQPC